MAKRKRDDREDDGHVIANMDVDGMPYTFRRGKRRNYDAFGKVKQKSDPIDLTRMEKRAIAWGAASAYLLVLGVFVVVFGLFLLFASKVWLNK